MKHHVAVLLWMGCCVQAATIPAGTELQVRLTSKASSEQPSGQAVSGVLIVPVLLKGVPVLAAGARLEGKTADAKPAKAATPQIDEQAATLRIDFTKITDQAGHTQPLTCVVSAVDNARETVDQSGLITGISVSKSYEGLLDQGLSKLSGQLGTLLTGVKGAILKEVDPSISYDSGVELTMKLTKDLDWGGAPPPSTIGAITPADTLAALVASAPFRTVAQNPPEPSDLINLMFLGSRDQIQAAFKEAGWLTAAELSANSKLETARAIIENRGYSEAPMSVLFLEGKPPEMTFQKQNDTFDKRHHIRIWMLSQKFNDQTVWVGSSTHDTGITLSPVTHNFTHGIDSNIDAERSKVVNDMLFTGKVKAVASVARPAVPVELSNATGDKLQTDRQIAVLQF
jgi:hypothetical protein